MAKQCTVDLTGFTDEEQEHAVENLEKLDFTVNPYLRNDGTHYYHVTWDLEEDFVTSPAFLKGYKWFEGRIY